MLIVDAQVHQPRPEKPLGAPGAETDHYGNLKRGGKGVTEEDWRLNVLVSVELAREAMDSVGVDAALLNGPMEFMDAAVERYPERFAACAHWDPEITDADGWIGSFRAGRGHLAIRAGFGSPAHQAGQLEPLFVSAAKQGVPVFGGFRANHAVAPIAEAHPHLTIVVDHFGLSQPPVYKQRPDPWDQLPTTLALAKYPNVLVKFSGAPALSLTPYPHPDIWPHLHKVVDAFTPDRLMWASDFTRMRMSEGNTAVNGPKSAWGGLYGDAVGFLRDTREISQSDKEKIFSGTFRRVLGWPKAA